MSKAKILLVEDNETNLLFFSDLLRTKGYEVVTAKSGYEAFEWLEQFRPDLILLDMHLPEMDGLSIVRAIRSSDEMAGVKVVALSALSMESDIEAAYQAGCDGYITKPVGMKEFLQKMESYLR
ncbi:response regulator [Thermicanus aegyptius]|uniref:response regulator n=1 Tax=Thermicanus aegyptius TaxID=94009 RepID=UPI0003FD10C9|nr:response regulator [Thermicanus aegyptius]MBE3554659.1 response regulator [Thermicanus sp.]